MNQEHYERMVVDDIRRKIVLRIVRRMGIALFVAVAIVIGIHQAVNL